MAEVWHTMGDDLVVSANGDLLVADGVDVSEQRVLRRLLTNTKDYIWQPEYGAGLPQKIGDPFTIANVQAIIAGQMNLEDTVVRDPPPVVVVTSFANDLFANITYQERDTGNPVVLGFAVNPQGVNG